MNVETAIDAITDYCNALDLAEDEHRADGPEPTAARVSSRSAYGGGRDARLATISQQLTARVNRTLQQSRKRGGRS